MRHWMKFAYLATVYLFLYFPIGVLVTYSFNVCGVSTDWQGFTFHWYRQLLANPELLQVTLHSLTLGFAAATLATMLGTLAAICLYRYRFYGRQLLSALLFTLVISPEIVIAVGLLLFFIWSGIPLGFTSLLVAHTTFCMPFVAVMIYTRLLGIENNVIKAAKELGANEFSIFYRILLPLLRLNICSGWLLSFTLSMDDVMVSFFSSGPSFKVLPLELYAWVRLGVKPELNALCSSMLFLTLVVVVLSQFVATKHE